MPCILFHMKCSGMAQGNKGLTHLENQAKQVAASAQAESSEQLKFQLPTLSTAFGKRMTSH